MLLHIASLFSTMEEPTTPTTSNSSFNSNFSSNSNSISSPSASPKQHSSLRTSKQTTANADNPEKRQRSSDDKHPAYRGVRMRSRGKWVSEIREPNKKSRIWLGTFPNPEMAALEIKGHNAHLNFPSLAPLFPRPASTCPKDIQAAATQAAQTEIVKETQSRSNNGDGNDEEELFDLPDILYDLRDGYRYGLGLSRQVTWAPDEEVEFRLHEPLLWE